MTPARRQTEQRRLKGAPSAIVGGVDEPGVPPMTRAELERCRVLLERAGNGRMVARLRTLTHMARRGPRHVVALITCKQGGALN